MYVNIVKVFRQTFNHVNSKLSYKMYPPTAIELKPAKFKYNLAKFEIFLSELRTSHTVNNIIS